MTKEEEERAWANVMRGFEESKRLNDELGNCLKEAVSDLKAMFAESKAEADKRQAEYEKRQAEAEKLRAESKAEADKRQAEYEKRQAESKAEADKRQAEYEKRQAESNAAYEKRQAEYEKLRAESNAAYEKRQAESNAAYEKRQAESNAAYEKRQAEYEKLRAESNAAYEKRQAEYEKLRAESNAAYEKRQAKLDVMMAELSKSVNGISDSNGMFAEELFFNTLSEKKEFAGIHYDDVENGVGCMHKQPDGRRLKDQFDILMLNDASVAIVEVKYKARKADVETLAKRKVENFKILFPEYKDLKIYLGLGALAFEKDVVEEAKKYGVGLLKQVGDTIEYATDWEVKAY